MGQERVVAQLARGTSAPAMTVTADTTLTPANVNNLIEINAAATKVMTLPAASAVQGGQRFRFVQQVATSSGVGHTIHPVGTDVMRGNGFTPSAAKGAVNTQATARIGDAITVESNGVDAWYIVSLTGAWAREA